MIKTLYIPIPARTNSPETNLYLSIVAEDEESLSTKPYIFVLPGGPGFNHSHYKDYDCLQKVGNVVFHDPRGCGLSDKGNPITYSMDNYIQDIEAIRRFLELQEIILVGKSYGAMCALGYSLRYPEAVSSLVLAAGAPSYRFLETAKNNLSVRNLTDEQNKVCEKLWKGSFNNNEELAYFIDIMGPVYSYKKRHGGQPNRPVPDFPYACEPLNQGFGDFLRHFDYEDQLQDIQCNTLILVGEEDWITDKRHSQDMANKIPKSKIIIFPNSDHSMESDVPDLFFKAIADFASFEPKKNFGQRFFDVESNSQQSNNTGTSSLNCNPI